MIVIRQYNKDTDFDIWNNFVVGAKNSLFMHDRNFMDYHADRFVDNSLMFFDDEDLLALLPCNKKDNVLYSHGGLTYGGFITDTSMKQHKMLDCFEVLKEYMKQNGFKSIIYKTIPYCYDTNASQEDLYALFRNNAKVLKIEASTLVDFMYPIKMPKGRKAQIGRAKREGVTIELSTDYESFIELENQVLSEHHNTKAVHTGAELTKLHNNFPDKIELYAAMYQGKMIAGTVVFVYNNVIHTQYMAANPIAREIGALDYAVSEVIAKYKESKRYLDFGISTEEAGQILNEGLISQKEGFGGRTIAYQTWQLDI
ncbi:Acetyltransferase (GNAT) domain-containing protein [Treponema berlinense]|uniref:Acetyltransferase (GNAT) domain-containing protein n=1 Tax=Treponema berlinense TaxID=225004 RepID=A0A1T4MIW4_9SPIR|nr:GNAT family N-acetyltransferase [Treponema berlinense]SJZ66698.1 Acetyltransferase (GNAT) domain-containing protein [Treponema berlinense]